MTDLANFVQSRAYLALALLVLVSYLPAMLWGGFVWDDVLITQTEPVREAAGLWRIWFSPSDIKVENSHLREGHYWPLVYTTFWLEHKLWGFAPAGYHVVNVLLHLANTLLLWRLLLRLAAPGAWVVAAVFAVHPLHVESVAWVIERKDVLSGLFYLSAALAYMRFVETRRPGRYALALGLFVAGLLSKSIVVTLPVALLIWHGWKQGRVTTRDWLRLAPFFAVGLAITVADLEYVRSFLQLSLGYSALERLLIAARALWFYVGKLVWPTDLAVIYPLWDVRVADPLAWGYVVAAVGVAVALWLFRHRIGRGPLAGVLFFAVTLSPVLGFVDHSYMQYAFVADRHQYLAGIGVMAVVIGSVAHVLPSGLWGRAGTLALVAVVLVILSVLTWRQAGIYRDGVAFNRHIITLNPQALNAHSNLSAALFEQGRLEEALTAARIAVEQHPDSGRSNFGLGTILIELERYDEAARSLQRTVDLDSGYISVHYHLGLALFKQGHLEEALAAARTAVDWRPDWAKANDLIGAVLGALGRHSEAEQYLRRAVALDSSDTRAHLNLGLALFDQGRLEEALAALRPAVDQRPDWSEANAQIGEVLTRLGRYDEAEKHLRRAVELDSSYTKAYFNLGLALFDQGRLEEALAAARVAVEQRPDWDEALDALGSTLLHLGRPEEAEEHLRYARELSPQDTSILQHLAESYRLQERYEEALEAYDAIIRAEPDYALAHAARGAALYQLGKLNEALQSIDRALVLDPDLETAQIVRARLLDSME